MYKKANRFVEYNRINIQIIKKKIITNKYTSIISFKGKLRLCIFNIIYPSNTYYPFVLCTIIYINSKMYKLYKF